MRSRAYKPFACVGEKRRVNLKIDESLAEWAFDYAKAHNKSLTQLIVDQLAGLKIQEETELHQDAEQI